MKIPLVISPTMIRRAGAATVGVAAIVLLAATPADASTKSLSDNVESSCACWTHDNVTTNSKGEDIYFTPTKALLDNVQSAAELGDPAPMKNYVQRNCTGVTS